MSRLAKYAAPALAAVAGLLATGAPASAVPIGGSPTLTVLVTQPATHYTGDVVTFTATTTGATVTAPVLLRVVSGPNAGKARTLDNLGGGNYRSRTYIGADVPNAGTDQVKLCIDAAPTNGACDPSEVSKVVSVSWYAAPRMTFDKATIPFPGGQHVVVSGTVFCDGGAQRFVSHLNVTWFSAPATSTPITYRQIFSPGDCTTQPDGFGMTFETDFVGVGAEGSPGAMSLQAFDGDTADTMGVSVIRHGADALLFNAPQRALSKGSVTYSAGSAVIDN